MYLRRGMLRDYNNESKPLSLGPEPPCMQPGPPQTGPGPPHTSDIWAPSRWDLSVSTSTYYWFLSILGLGSGTTMWLVGTWQQPLTRSKLTNSFNASGGGVPCRTQGMCMLLSDSAGMNNHSMCYQCEQLLVSAAHEPYIVCRMIPRRAVVSLRCVHGRHHRGQSLAQAARDVHCINSTTRQQGWPLQMSVYQEHSTAGTSR